MSKILDTIFDFFEDLGRARAAHQLAVLGHVEEAKQIMLKTSKEFEVHP